MKKENALVALALAAILSAPTAAQTPDAPKPAAESTRAANAAFGKAYDLASQQDFEDAARGLVAQLPGGIIRNDKGEAVWDLSKFGFIGGDAPDTVNPSLWRQEKLNNNAGLFKVTDGIWQVRGYDMANMTLVAGKTGWIVIDPLLTAEAARASLAFALEKLGQKPVVAVLYTHSHVDHFGGVRGVVAEEDVLSGKVPIIAPDGFMDHAIAENVLAGNAMTRRAHYMYGTPLPIDAKGNVGSGLGKGLSSGTIGLIAPTDIVRKTGEERVVDGVRIVFQMANGSEAPAEFTFYFPELKALCLSEVVTAHLHNIYTLRGAKVRDALGWSKYINEMIDLFPEAQVAFRSHHWPVWSPERIRKHLANQRDAYRFIHDEALHLANSGKTMSDIGAADHFPKGLANDFSTHGYYGTLSHNLRAVYNFYLGFYDANPATLNPMPVVETAKRYVAAMGGADAVYDQAAKAAAAGDYRWAAELGNHLVLSDGANTKARALQADALEQLGYRAESAPWRNAYLTGAQELRVGIKPQRASTQGADVIRSMPLDMIFDFLSVRMDHKAADGQDIGVNLVFSDLNETWALELSNGVLNHTKGRVLKNANATLTLTRAVLFKILIEKASLPGLLLTGQASLSGNPLALRSLFANVKEFEPLFPIVTR